MWPLRRPTPASPHKWEGRSANFPRVRPEIKTALPGPKAAELIARDAKAMSPSFTRSYPFVMERGQGCWVTDVDGNRFLDFTAGIAVVTTGHSHPKVVAAIKEQAERFIHMSGTDFYYQPEIELAERLENKILPGTPAKVFFTNSGAEAIEGAMKLARYTTNRQSYIAFIGAFHGRTFGALSLTASKASQRRRFAPLLSQVFHAPFPAAARSRSARQRGTRRRSAPGRPSRDRIEPQERHRRERHRPDARARAEDVRARRQACPGGFRAGTSPADCWYPRSPDQPATGAQP